MFGPSTPVLAPRRADYKGSFRWILWPARQYRVVAPVLGERHLNAFQRAVLGLTLAGIRDTGEVARQLGLVRDLVGLIESDLTGLGYLASDHTVTDQGWQAWRDGYLDPSRVVVTHVYQDPFTGQLWSAAEARPQWVSAHWDRAHPRLALGAAGQPGRNHRALVVWPPAGEHPGLPTAEEVVDAAARAARADRPNRRGLSPDGAAIPERISQRVSMISDHGLAVFLPFVLLASGRSDAGDDGRSPTWFAFSPFTGRHSDFARRIVTLRCETNKALRQCLEGLLGRPADSFMVEYDRLTEEIRRQKVEFIERRFGHRIQAHPELRQQLVVLEAGYDSAVARGHSASQRELAVLYSWKCCELMLRQMVRAFRIAVTDLNRLPQDRKGFRHELGQAAQEIGLTYGDVRQLHDAVNSPDRVVDLLRKPKGWSNAPVLVAATVLGARHHPAHHPLRTLAPRYAHLIPDLLNLNRDRNDSAHAGPADIPEELVRSGRALAHDLTTAFLAEGIPSHG